jgi:glycosyltransferase involved in cell wall biosynthesis
MRILVLAPHPFFQLRGTPIDVDILLRVLSTRPGVTIDLVVYGEGEEISYPNITVHRTPLNSVTRGVKPGFSLRKVANDLHMLRIARRLVRRHSYDVVHAGEEAVLIARLIKRWHRIPYIYDLDSSIAQQMVEQRPWMRPVAGVLNWFEAGAVRGALATAPVCNALADLCRRHGARHVVTLHDISQLSDPDRPPSGRLQQEAGTDRLILLYVGNLEPYQGVDLLLEAFSIAARRTDEVDLVVIGGREEDIRRYKARAEALSLHGRAHFLGQRPLSELDEYLADADILTAPRTKGINTPMKIFPYMHSGKALLVTDLPTHSQILTSDVCMLAAPEPQAFADAIVELASDRELRERLGRAGRAFVEAEHTFEAHARRVNALYDHVDRAIR